MNRYSHQFEIKLCCTPAEVEGRVFIVEDEASSSLQQKLSQKICTISMHHNKCYLVLPLSEVILDSRSKMTGVQGISLRQMLAVIDPLIQLTGLQLFWRLHHRHPRLQK